jgi:adenine phosphoribosyltransferase
VTADLDVLLGRLVRDVADFPSPGVVFKDVSPLLADPEGLRSVVTALARAGRDAGGVPAVDKVVGLEARGFIFAAPVALELGTGFVPVRKAGKLPSATHRVAYALEYGEAVLEIHRDALRPGDRVLVVDDVLATGGTAAAARSLVEACGATVAAVSVLLELASLEGRAALGETPVHVLQVVRTGP